MSLLDDDIIVDPIQSLVIRYLTDHDTNFNFDGVCVTKVKKYYKCDSYLNPEMEQIDYDDQPYTWYLMKKYGDDNVYITKWIDGPCRYKLGIHALKHLKHTGDKRYTLITLEDILNEFA